MAKAPENPCIKLASLLDQDVARKMIDDCLARNSIESVSYEVETKEGLPDGDYRTHVPTGYSTLTITIVLKVLPKEPA
jgi:hypothetical protein